jgi:hypothetical protein
MKKTLLLAVGLFACAEEADDRGPSGSSTPQSKTTHVLASTGGIASSLDGRLQVEFLPGALSADADVTITQGLTSPAPTVTVGGAFRVALAPTSVTLGSAAEMGFAVSSADANRIGQSNLRVGKRSGTTGDFDDILFGSYDSTAQRFYVDSSTFSDFAVIDGASYVPCACNTSGGCDAGCSCDADCDSGNPYDGSWTFTSSVNNCTDATGSFVAAAGRFTFNVPQSCNCEGGAGTVTASGSGTFSTSGALSVTGNVEGPVQCGSSSLSCSGSCSSQSSCFASCSEPDYGTTSTMTLSRSSN